MFKTKKKAKNAKNDMMNNIKPQRHPRIDNLNYYSEEIVKEIIDKIISLTFTKLFSQKLEGKVSNYCLDSVYKALNNFLQLSYINYDHDDLYYTNDILIQKKYCNTDENKFKHKIHIKINSKKKFSAELDLNKINKELRNEIIIKNKSISDYLSHSFEQPKNNYIKSPNTLFYDTKKNNDNFWGFIDQPKSNFYHRMISKSNQISQIAQSYNEIKESEEHIVKRKSRFYTFRRNSSLFFKKKTTSMATIDDMPLRTRLYKIIKMSDIRNVEEHKLMKPKESEEIIELRRQKNEELLKIKEENLKKLRMKEKTTEKKMAFNAYNIKINFVDKEKDRIFKDKNRYIEMQMKKGNFNTDFNGNIVIINEINPENLAKDLPSLLTKFKDIGKDKNSELEKTNIDSDALKTIVKNTNILNKKKQKSNLSDMKYKNALMPEYLKYKIEPSGSNFDLIQPEIGVTIHEKMKTKSGGKKFFEKYHKFSMKDFNMTLKETLEKERQDIKEKILENLNKSNDLKYLSVNLEKKISNINNNYTINKDNNLLEKTFNNELEIKSYISKKREKNKAINKSQSEILLKNKSFSLLQDLFGHDNSDTKLNYLEARQKEDIIHGKINQKNLFLNKIKGLKNTKDYRNSNTHRLIDKFNKSIISGNKNSSAIANYVEFKKIVHFPIIPFKRNRSQNSLNKYSNSTSNFFRTRIKKNINKFL